MRWVSSIITACILMISLNCASAQGDNISDLKKLISSNEDTRMNSQDLAFFLATHNYNAEPKDSYVELDLNGKICKLIPNGEKSGLCDLAF
ncbi:MAG TPA: hypothetical protein VMY43_07190 [Methanothrix sp.]|nr:hypothetical protein [Methanothrix sp.]